VPPSSPSDPSRPPPERSIGLVGATGIGLGAIVGGGILVLAGVAFRTAGPSALLAFALNGGVAILTAMSFAEMSGAFPESGGAYVFAKKVLSVRAAFVVGWITWFAYIVAGVLYALGFAEYAVAGLGAVLGRHHPAWLGGHATTVVLGFLATAAYAAALLRRAAGAGQWATWGKIGAFAVVIVAGFWALLYRDDPAIRSGMTPFFDGGGLGLVQAMGFTFIALQGFEVIAAVAGEVRRPERTIPRAMLLSLACALVVYLPLLFVVATAGVVPGDSVTAMSQRHPGTIMAEAVDHYLGPAGFWLVVVAAVLSTLSALHANLLAASRVAFTMARDRTLPIVFGTAHPSRGTPVLAVYGSALALVAVLFVVPDLAAAGAAASLSFLVAFGLAHWTSFLARRRRPNPPPGAFRTPWFPVVQVVGGTACVALAAFQAIAVPAAGAIALIWVGLGLLLYFGLFSSRASALDAFSEAVDPELHRLRGTNPVVLVPVANPTTAPMLVSIAGALAPPRVGRVLLMNVIRGGQGDEAADAVTRAQAVLGAALRATLDEGHQPQALLSVADSPWSEIRRVARAYRCQGVLLGRAQLDERGVAELEALLNDLDADVSLLLAPEGWALDAARHILVPVGGGGDHGVLRARVLGSLCRDGQRTVTWLRVLPAHAHRPRLLRAEAELAELADDATPERRTLRVVQSDDALATLSAAAHDADLMVVGLPRQRRRTSFGRLVPALVRSSPCATLILSERR
jgi:APA family basic amino acid/polyamine antiporter